MGSKLASSTTSASPVSRIGNNSLKPPKLTGEESANDALVLGIS